LRMRISPHPPVRAHERTSTTALRHLHPKIFREGVEAVVQLARCATHRLRTSRFNQADERRELWGGPRIHGELMKLRFEVAQSAVAKYMVQRRGPVNDGFAYPAKREVIRVTFTAE